MPIAATIALEMIGPIPGTVISRSQPEILAGQNLDLFRQPVDALIELAPIASQILDDPYNPRRQDIGWHSQDAR